jgi:hypothetical protein
MTMIAMTLPQFGFLMESGVLALHDGFVVTFFLFGNHQQNASMVRAAIKRYLKLPGMAANLGTIDEEGYPMTLDTQSLWSVIGEGLDSSAGAATTHIEEETDHSLVEASLQIIDSTEGAPRFSIRYFGFDRDKVAAGGWPHVASGIRFTFPTDFLGERGLREMYGFTNEVAAILPFSFGYVSPAFVYHEGIGEPAAFEMIRRLSRRYRCLDIPALVPDCLEIGDGPKGAYWGNYLSAPMVNQLGGEATIRGHFAGQEVRITIYDNGSMSVYLGRVPIAGDVNRREDVKVYKAASNLFSDFILPRSVLYLDFDEEAMSEWLHRFDDEHESRDLPEIQIP